MLHAMILSRFLSTGRIWNLVVQYFDGEAFYSMIIGYFFNMIRSDDQWWDWGINHLPESSGTFRSVLDTILTGWFPYLLVWVVHKNHIFLFSNTVRYVNFGDSKL